MAKPEATTADDGDPRQERRERRDFSYIVVNDDSADTVAPLVDELAGT